MIFLKCLLLLTVLSIDPGDIGKINTAKSEAKKAYLAGDFKTAIEKYRYLVDSAGVIEDEVQMNMANAYFHLNDTAQALGAYQPLSLSADKHLKSIANQQMGVMTNRSGKYEEALNYFKQALKADPTNDDARYNYEMVKKKIEEKKKQDQKDQKNQDQNKDQKDQQDKENKEQEEKEKKDQENKEKKDENKEKKDQEKKDQEQKDKDKEQKDKKDQEQKEDKDEKDKKETPPSVKDKLKDMNMSEEKAKMILEAMKNQEVQYLQQNKRKATKPKDRTKPDW